MIKSCNFGTGGGSSACQNLIQNKAETVFAPGTGVCYMFNFGLILSQQPNFGSNLNRSEVLMADSAYSSGGLKLEIDIECNFDIFVLLITNMFSKFYLNSRPINN